LLQETAAGPAPVTLQVFSDPHAFVQATFFILKQRRPTM
jgi:hypothetical protein